MTANITCNMRLRAFNIQVPIKECMLRQSLGPFVLATHNPFVYKPEGFTKGAGNGCLFQDRYGNDWYMVQRACLSGIFLKEESCYILFSLIKTV